MIEVDGNKIMYWVTEDGEYIDPILYQEKKDNRVKGMEYRKSTEASYVEMAEDLGSFSLVYYVRLTKLKIERQYILRFLYLITFMDYKYRLIFGKCKMPMLEKDLLEVLGMSEKYFFETKKVLIESGLLISNEKKELSVNEEIVRRGKIISKKESFIRMYDKAIKEIYESATAREHKKLGLLVELLQYVNYSTNILCINPKESNINFLEAVSVKDLTEKFGYSRIAMFKKTLFDITVQGEKAIMVATIGGKDIIVVNPKVFYKGKKIEELKGIENLFKVAQN